MDSLRPFITIAVCHFESEASNQLDAARELKAKFLESHLSIEIIKAGIEEEIRTLSEMFEGINQDRDLPDDEQDASVQVSARLILLNIQLKLLTQVLEYATKLESKRRPPTG